MTIPQAYRLAIQHHQAGRLAEAEALYRQILVVAPRDADVLHMLGLVAHQVGRNEAAAELMQQAHALLPNVPALHANLGVVYRALGRTDEAIAASRRALELQPGLAPAGHNLGLALADQGRLTEAIAAYQQALQSQPNHAEAHLSLGSALRAHGRIDEAIASYRRALALQPSLAEAHNNLGVALADLGRIDEAIAAYRRTLELRPNLPETWSNLGNVLGRRGSFDEAIAACQRALAIDPACAEACNNLGIVLSKQGQLDEALEAFSRAVKIKPDYAAAHNNRGITLNDKERFDDAIAAFSRALELQPDFADAHNSLGNLWKDLGRLDEAMRAYRRAVELDPGALEAHSNLVYVTHFIAGDDWGALRREQERWRQLHEVPRAPLIQPHRNDPQPGRKLKIGYVSPDFSHHVIGRNLLPLFAHHSREEVEIFCYSGVLQPDALTARFQKLADHWRRTLEVADAKLAEMIRTDGIDILVDLSLHMGGNRLTLFALKPAPVQVSFAAYPGTTGLAAIEYRLSDRHLETAVSAPADGREQICLLDSFWCFDRLEEAREPNALPALTHGAVTFGCLNNFCKVNEHTLDLWARVLDRVAGSRLLLMHPEGSQRAHTLEWFARHGIEASRIEFVERCPLRAYLAYHHRLDVILDTFPYNGHSTSLDALWMGVPVVSLAGQTPVSRAGLSQSMNLGLPELVAHSEDDYVRIAEELARDLPRLAALRGSLRARMQASPLMDAANFARQIEAAYRQMWQKWCAGHSPDR